MELTQSVSPNTKYLELDEPYEASGRLGFLELESEIVLVIRGEGTASLKVSRGQAGTTRAAHASGTPVTTHTEYLEAD